MAFGGQLASVFATSTDHAIVDSRSLSGRSSVFSHPTCDQIWSDKCLSWIRADNRSDRDTENLAGRPHPCHADGVHTNVHSSKMKVLRLST